MFKHDHISKSHTIPRAIVVGASLAGLVLSVRLAFGRPTPELTLSPITSWHRRRKRCIADSSQGTRHRS